MFQAYLLHLRKIWCSLLSARCVHDMRFGFLARKASKLFASRREPSFPARRVQNLHHLSASGVRYTSIEDGFTNWWTVFCTDVTQRPASSAIRPRCVEFHGFATAVTFACVVTTGTFIVPKFQYTIWLNWRPPIAKSMQCNTLKKSLKTGIYV